MDSPDGGLGREGEELETISKGERGDEDGEDEAEIWVFGVRDKAIKVERGE